MYWQKIDLSNDVSLMTIVHVVCDFRHERQYIMNTPRIRYFAYVMLQFFWFVVTIKIYLICLSPALHYNALFEFPTKTPETKNLKVLSYR